MMDICDDENIRATDLLLADVKSSSENEVYFKLREAEAEAHSTDQRHSHKEVMSEIRGQLSGMTSSD